MAKRLFSESSFWNTPIGPDVELDPGSDHFIELLSGEPNGPFGINLYRYTIPVYEVDSSVPRRAVARRIHAEEDLRARKSAWVGVGDRFNHCPEFDAGGVPVPEAAAPDPDGDAHLAIVSWDEMLAWDMWGARRLEDGSLAANTGMVYSLDGDGVFRTEQFGIADGESIHFYGPSRAAGVPAVAGLIMHDEVAEGEIRHKLACATRFNAFKEFVYPACWTDGHCDGGLPEGAVIQLDPDLDIDAFDLLPGERAVAKALQRYGMVDVDNAGGNTLYAEGLWAKPGRSWDGLLSPLGLMRIPIDHYRVLKLGPVVRMGMDRRSGVGH